MAGRTWGGGSIGVGWKRLQEGGVGECNRENKRCWLLSHLNAREEEGACEPEPGRHPGLTQRLPDTGATSFWAERFQITFSFNPSPPWAPASYLVMEGEAAAAAKGQGQPQRTRAFI